MTRTLETIGAVNPPPYITFAIIIKQNIKCQNFPLLATKFRREIFLIFMAADSNIGGGFSLNSEYSSAKQALL